MGMDAVLCDLPKALRVVGITLSGSTHHDRHSHFSLMIAGRRISVGFAMRSVPTNRTRALDLPRNKVLARQFRGRKWIVAYS